MSLIARHLAEALEWRYGTVADTAGEAITAWRHETEPQPDPAAVVAEYLAHLEADRPRREQIAQAEATAREFVARCDAAGLDWRAFLFAAVRDLCAALPDARKTQITQRWVTVWDNAAAAVAARRA